VKYLLPFLLAFTALAVADPNDGDLRQNASRQEQIRADSQLLVSRLDEVIAEYQRNGLANGDDFDALKTVRAALGSLSDDEMEQVVGLLKAAAGDRSQMAKAYAGQKDISLRLKQILADHQLNQDIDALASRVRQLADRQAANLNAAIDTGQLAAQDKSANGQAAVTASEQAQQSEESAIAAEVNLIATSLGQLASGQKYSDAAAELARVQPEAGSASDSLGDGNLDDAETVENVVHGQLEEVARALIPAGVSAPAPTGAAAALADLARDQHALLSKTAALAGALKKITDAETPAAADKAMYDQIKNPNSTLATALANSGITPDSPVDQIRAAPAMKAWLDAHAAALEKQEQALQPQLAALAPAQAALAAKAQLLRDDLQKSSSQFAAPLDNALPSMASAQQALAASNGGQAVQNESQSAAQLDNARRLAEQGGATPSQPLTPEQQLQQLQTGVNTLAAREKASLQQGDSLKTGDQAPPAAALQQSLADKATSLAQSAVTQSSPAAQALHQAADAFQKAAQLMSPGGNPEQAEAAQQSALQNLAQAHDQLAGQAADIAARKRDLATMQRLMAGLGDLVQKQQKLDQETAQADPAKSKKLAAAQSGIQSGAGNLQRAMAATDPDAAKALGDADDAMKNAAQGLAGQSPGQAKSPQQDAMTSLYKAQDALAGSMQKTAQSLGQSSAPASAGVASALSKAQGDLSAARQSMASGQPGGSGLQQATQHLAQASAQPQSLTQAARDALRDAQQALDQASAFAAAGQTAQAQSQAAAASQSIAAAESALDQQQAGIAGLSPSSGDQPGNGQPSPGAQPAGGNQESSASRQSSAIESSSPGQPSSASSQQSGQSTNQATKGGSGAAEKSWQDQSGAAKTAANSTQGPGAFQGLPDRDRAAIQQSQTEKYPQEYGSMVEQYMRNLATDTGDK